MVGEQKFYQGQRVQVMGIVNGDEVVVQLPDGSRRPVNRAELSDPPKAESNRPIITKGAEADSHSDAAADAASQGAKDAETAPPSDPPAPSAPSAT